MLRLLAFALGVYREQVKSELVAPVLAVEGPVQLFVRHFDLGFFGDIGADLHLASQVGLDLAAFREQMQDVVDDQLGDSLMPRPRLLLDGIVDFSQIDSKLIEELDNLGPFGAGNAEPVLLASRTFASNARIVSDKHLRARFRDGSGTLDGFGFAMSESLDILRDPVSIAFVPRQFRRHGKPRLEIQIRDVRVATDSCPDRVQLQD